MTLKDELHFGNDAQKRDDINANLTENAGAADAVAPRAELLAPDTGRPLSTQEKWRFGIGFALFSLLWMTAGTSGSQILLPQRFTELGIGVPEVILGTMNSVGCIFALAANIIFGALSDLTRSRFGKRTPWIIAGGFVTALGYLWASSSTELVGIVAGWCVVQVGVNMMIAPAVAILSDRIPEGSRGLYSALYGGAQIVGQSSGTLLGAQFITHQSLGFMTGVALFAITGIAGVLIWPREQSSLLPAVHDGDASTSSSAHKGLNGRELLRSFIPPTKNCRDFYLALVGRLLLMVGWSMVATYQLYILEKYVHLSVKAAGGVISTMSVLSMIALMVTTLISGPVSDLIGRRKILVAFGSVIIAIAMIIPMAMPTTLGMMLYAGIGGLGYGIYIAVDQALNVDVLPNAQESGKDLGILNLANTVGQVIAPVIVGALVVATGQYVLIFPIACACVLLGAVIIMFIRSVK